MAEPTFKSRFLAALPDVPVELDLELDEFVQFDKATLQILDKDDATLLLEQGLPRQAPPFLNFESYSLEQIDSRVEMFGIPPSYFPIGSNGYGDVLAIDLTTREIVYINHDCDNSRVFINSSLRQFHDCLCLFQEHHTHRTMANCLADIAKVDSKAALADSMWSHEIATSIES